MTETPILDESAVSEIEARANAATEGPWAVWDSCSWRRIGTKEPFADGNVICPITQNDEHPDLLAKREDLEFVAHARADIPALCATVKHLRAEVEELSERLIKSADRSGGLLVTNGELRAENERLRSEHRIAVRFLSRQGFERCVGHCDSWHQKGERHVSV